MFFTDGARDLRKAIHDTFHFIPFKIILDWFHLKKKCKDLLSMAITGKKVKNQILTAVARLVVAWEGGSGHQAFTRSEPRVDQKSQRTP